MTPDITIVVPVYRNAASLRELRDRIFRACEGLAVEIIFVDDACPEGSLAVLRDLAESDPQVVVVALERNVGQHQAVLTGLAHARGRAVAIMDADLQDPPEALPVLLARLQAGCAAVFAGRLGRYESTIRLATSRLFKWTLHVLAGVPVDAGIFCLLSRKMVDRLLTMPAGRPSVLAMIGCTGLSHASVPVARADRPAAQGRSAYNTRGRAASAWRAVTWVVRWKLARLTGHRPTRAAAAPIKVVYDHRPE